jgi:hypothetical protein
MLNGLIIAEPIALASTYMDVYSTTDNCYERVAYEIAKTMKVDPHIWWSAFLRET